MHFQQRNFLILNEIETVKNCLGFNIYLIVIGIDNQYRLAQSNLDVIRLSTEVKSQVSVKVFSSDVSIIVFVNV